GISEFVWRLIELDRQALGYRYDWRRTCILPDAVRRAPRRSFLPSRNELNEKLRYMKGEKIEAGVARYPLKIRHIIASVKAVHAPFVKTEFSHVYFSFPYALYKGLADTWETAISIALARSSISARISNKVKDEILKERAKKEAEKSSKEIQERIRQEFRFRTEE
ncbi:MAG: hypothetical protein NZ891_04410, partial [bacterium]|nr:hypothetical protein [bacterium]MDW8163966.1 hypothetical protein [Candidatus Omnitrophota bacterium]